MPTRLPRLIIYSIAWSTKCRKRPCRLNFTGGYAPGHWVSPQQPPQLLDDSHILPNTPVATLHVHVRQHLTTETLPCGSSILAD